MYIRNCDNFSCVLQTLSPFQQSSPEGRTCWGGLVPAVCPASAHSPPFHEPSRRAAPPAGGSAPSPGQRVHPTGRVAHLAQCGKRFLSHFKVPLCHFRVRSESRVLRPQCHSPPSWVIFTLLGDLPTSRPQEPFFFSIFMSLQFILFNNMHIRVVTNSY